MSSIGDCESDMIGVLGLNSVGEEKTRMFNTYSNPLQTHLRSYEFTWDTCHSGNSNMAPRRGEEHDSRNAISLHKDKMHDDATKLGDFIVSVRTPTHQELRIAERAAA